ncbi:baseplate J/gp47 family protein [Xanthobacter agilis]|uniref:Phage protein gp47/JayE n=1 Tax=Xanthobacter agilis TaxID=47492 RepID=A0ABU0LJV8_XANAG|nr:baseplate J/gp47 family protein [Xanthobacter agilis]MDQ0507427.1 putative phage protein gp47/JayE [Xanthobacter agilis]
MAITCTIDSTGITAPTLTEIRAWLVEQYRSIYGSDIYLGSDSQDGQWIGILATALHDANAMCVSAYEAFSPATAQGEGLARMVKINGITKQSASKSSVDLLLGGTVGTIISNGYATDDAGTKWMLPTTVTIPSSAQITVTATASEAGAISAAAKTITTIGTPTRGWQTVTNPTAADKGDAVETDAALRRRQATSTEIPSKTVFRGLIGAIADLDGVSRYGGIENDGDGEDTNGIPGHSIAVVVEGGVSQDVADTIYAKKGPGCGTYGTTAMTVTDIYGVPHRVEFSRPSYVTVKVSLHIIALSGYSSAIAGKIRSAIVSYITGLDFGAEVYIARLYVPANLSNTSNGETFEITSLRISRAGGTLGTDSLSMAFDEAPTCTTSDIAITVS